MQERTERFLKLSEALTGFGLVELLGTGMADEYLRTLDAVLSAGMTDELLELSGALPTGGELSEEQASGLLGDPKLGPLVQNLVLLWYCGTWTALPNAWSSTYGTSPLDTNRVVSAAAYQAALQWVAAGAHPAGAMQQGFGAWAMAPERDVP